MCQIRMPQAEDSHGLLRSLICLRRVHLLPDHGDDAVTDKKNTREVCKGVPIVDDEATADMMSGITVALQGMRRLNRQRSRYSIVRKGLRVLGMVEAHSVGRWPVLISEEAGGEVAVR